MAARVPRSRVSSPAGDLLIVDDDPDVARALARALMREGFRVAVAHTAERAIALSVAGGRAIVDIELGEESGLDLALDLLTQKRTRSIVFFSGTSDAHDLTRATKIGKLVRKADGVDALLEALLCGP